MRTENNKKKLFDRDVIIGALSSELEMHFELEESKKFEDFKNRKEGQFFIKKNCIDGSIRFFGHYEPGADILINDCLFNTLGMVYVFCEDEPNGKSTGSCSDFLMDCIDKAGYVRHLFLRNAETENERTGGDNKIQARCVELVIVCADSLKVDFGNTLREIAQKTDYLYSIGVNLLTISDPLIEGNQKNKGKEKYFKERDIERTFSWLLRKTRQWYKKLSSNGGVPLTEITLDNYRLPGKRVLTLHPEKKIHLVYGHNGSGKSTIVEALEMAITGRAERLGGISNYHEVIKNIYSNEPASIAVKLDGEEQKQFQVEGTGISKPMNKELKATSFRLDQAVMERLTRAGNGERADVFIDAFFPDDREIVEKYNASRDKSNKYFEELPKGLKESIINKKKNREDAVVESLAVLEKENAKKPRKLVDACLPIPIESLGKLTPLSPGLSGPLEPLAQGLISEKVLKQIDSALEPLFNDIESILTGLQEGVEILTQLNKWHASPRYAVDFRSALDKWLEMTALTDLLDKYYILVKSLKEAGSKQWNMDEDIAQIFDQALFTVDDEMIKEKKKTLTLKLDQMRTLLEPTAIRDNKKGSVQSSVQPHLSPSETGILNRLGDWLSCPGLGKTIKETLSKNETSRLDESLTIGVQNWADGLIEKTKDLLAVCNELKNPGMPGKSCIDRFRHLNNTLQTYKDLKEMGENIHKTFLKLLEKDKDGNLIEVLNELTNLFTPSRWAYEDISIEHEYWEKKHKLHFRIGETNAGRGEKARADFRLNAAELNIFALSLFSLCAVRNKNPLSLLIYDDPLQNMDEITVTTLARGFNKLIKLFPGDWQIMMLFHGHEDLERFCREIPAPVYYLPWLSPSSKAEEKKIEHDTITGQVSAGNQNLSEIVEIRA